jgi:hypothetical protein
MMSYRDNRNFSGEFPHDNVVGKSFEDESFRASPARYAGHTGKRDDLIFEEVESRIYGFGKFNAKTGGVLARTTRRPRWLPAWPHPGYVRHALSTPEPLLEPTPKSVAINYLCSTCIDFRQPAKNFLIPFVSSVGVAWRIETLYQVVRQFCTLGFGKSQ